MQIKMKFRARENIVLPIHYNSIVHGFIYNNIDESLANFLHNEGYEENGRQFKMFSFSRILSKGRKKGENLDFGRTIELVFSSPLEEFFRSFVGNIIVGRNLRLGRNIIELMDLEVLDTEVDSNTIRVRTLSPLVNYSTFLKADGGKYTNYYRYRDRDFERLVRENLIKKYNILYEEELEDQDFKIELVGQEMENFVYFKRTIIKGVSGEFKLTGDRRLLKTALDTGLGSKNSQGFGCIQKKG